MNDTPAPASKPDATYDPSLYNAHLWLEWIGLTVFIVGLVFFGEPRVMPLFGLLAIASGVVGLRAGRTMGTFFGHLLARAHEDDSLELQLELRRRYSRVSAVWRIVIGALIVGLSAYFGLVTR